MWLKLQLCPLYTNIYMSNNKEGISIYTLYIRNIFDTVEKYSRTLTIN